LDRIGKERLIMHRLFKWLCRLGLHRDDFNSYGAIPTDVYTCRHCGRQLVREYDPYDEIVCP